MNRSRNRYRLGGFTLVELLVVIGIIVLLVSILVPTLQSSIRRANRARSKADLSTIDTALGAYKQDFGDIPRIPIFPTTAAPPLPGTPIPNSGALILTKALLGPGGDGYDYDPKTMAGLREDKSDPPNFDITKTYKAGDAATNTNVAYVANVDSPSGAPLQNEDWTMFDPRDGLDGPGFRLQKNYQAGTGTMLATGKAYGPYVQSGKLKNNGMFLLDQVGQPILYFPARPGSIDITKTTAGPAKPYVDQYKSASGKPVESLWNASDNFEAFRRRPSEMTPSTTTDDIVLRRIRVMLGDLNYDGVIQGDETPVKRDYLLWTTGPDGIFGPLTLDLASSPDASTVRTAVGKSDDVTNFRE